MIKALLWKDYRVNLWLLTLAVALLIGPPLCAAALNLHGQLTIGSAPRAWADLLVLTAPFSLAAQLLTIVMLGANAFAAERADRSAEFLAYLPPSRWANVASKAIFAIGVCVFVWGAGLMTIYVVAPQVGVVSADLVEFRDGLLPTLAASSVMLFGVAWLGSTFLSSHTFATGLGIAGPLALLGVLQLWHYYFAPSGFELGYWYRALCWPLGLAAFVAGTVYYVRRVEP